MTERKAGAMRSKASWKDVLAEGGREGKEQYKEEREPHSESLSVHCLPSLGLYVWASSACLKTAFCKP